MQGEFKAEVQTAPAVTTRCPDGRHEGLTAKPGSKVKMAAFALMLVVPAALTGCGYDDDCDDPDYYNPDVCDYDSNGGYYGSSYYGGSSSGSKKSSSSYKSGSSHSGFGSGGSVGSFFSGG